MSKKEPNGTQVHDRYNRQIPTRSSTVLKLTKNAMSIVSNLQQYYVSYSSTRCPAAVLHVIKQYHESNNSTI